MRRQKYVCACACNKQQRNTLKRKWNKEFFIQDGRNGTLHDPLWTETLEKIDVRRNLHDAFLYVSEISGLSWKVEGVQEFLCEAGDIPDAKMWIDIRLKDVETSSWHSKWITSEQLAEVVAQQRTEQQPPSTSCRQLYFVPYASPRIIDHMMRSATTIQIDALRQATCQYFGEETLIRAQTFIKGFPVFWLTFNLPCLTLEEAEENESNVQPQVDGHNKKLWESLSHVSIRSRSGEMSDRFAIFETRTTVVISGSSNTDWSGYALGNVGSVDVSCTDREQENNGDVVSIDCNDEDEGLEPEEDYFATGGCESVIYPEDIILDPRVYYLRAVQIRLAAATQASEFLVGKLDAGCSSLIRELEDHETRKALDQISQMSRVSRHLHKHFAQSLRAWSRFRKGDAQYFADLRTHPIANEAWSSISRSFEKISDLNHGVKRMMEDSAESTKILNVRMTQMNHFVSLENFAMTRKSTEINFKASRHSESAAESASKSLAAAEDTSRSSRVNVQLFMLTTAFIIALQYFCSERALFAFERSPQAFWISIVVLVPSLLCLSFALYAFDHLKEILAKRMTGSLDKLATPAAIPEDPAV